MIHGYLSNYIFGYSWNAVMFDQNIDILEIA